MKYIKGKGCKLVLTAATSLLSLSCIGLAQAATCSPNQNANCVIEDVDQINIVPNSGVKNNFPNPITLQPGISAGTNVLNPQGVLSVPLRSNGWYETAGVTPDTNPQNVFMFSNPGSPVTFNVTLPDGKKASCQTNASSTKGNFFGTLSGNAIYRYGIDWLYVLLSQGPDGQWSCTITSKTFVPPPTKI